MNLHSVTEEEESETSEAYDETKSQGRRLTPTLSAIRESTANDFALLHEAETHSAKSKLTLDTVPSESQFPLVAQAEPEVTGGASSTPEDAQGVTALELREAGSSTAKDTTVPRSSTVKGVQVRRASTAKAKKRKRSSVSKSGTKLSNSMSRRASAGGRTLVALTGGRGSMSMRHRRRSSAKGTNPAVRT